MQVVCGVGIKWFRGVVSTCGRCADVFEIFEGLYLNGGKEKGNEILEKRKKEEKQEVNSKSGLDCECHKNFGIVQRFDKVAEKVMELCRLVRRRGKMSKYQNFLS